MAKDIYLASIPDEFWRIVEAARQDPDRMTELLKKEKPSRKELKHLSWTFEALANELREGVYTEYTAPELSEDGIFEVAHWVVAQGKEFYEKVWEDPSKMPRTKKHDPGLWAAIENEYEERFGAGVPLKEKDWDVDWRKHGKKSPWD